MKLTVDDHIPAPNSRIAGRGKYPFHLLKKKGQSMLIPRSYATSKQVNAAAYNYRRTKDSTFHFTVRRVLAGKHDVVGCRIWRI